MNIKDLLEENSSWTTWKIKEMKEIDVTNKISYSEFDIGLLDINRCLCGAEYDRADLIISDERDRPVSCDKCGRKFYFTNSIKVFMVEE